MFKLIYFNFVDTCNDGLGMRDGSISDSQISSSSVHQGTPGIDYGARNARLYNHLTKDKDGRTSGWVADITDPNPWIQVIVNDKHTSYFYELMQNCSY